MTTPPGRIPLPFATRKPVVGMVHLLPLPGSPGWKGSMEAVMDRAQADVEALVEGGVDGILVENFGDVPFLPGPLPPETVAALARAVGMAVAVSGVPVGVNALRNDGLAALGIAVAEGADFIRVNVHTGTLFTDQGMIQGTAHETLRRRAALGSPVAILADVLVKHATPPPGTELGPAARDTWERGGADGLLVTGAGTGLETSSEDLEVVRAAAPEAPVWVASGVTAETAPALLARADGAIVGSAFMNGGRAGNPVVRDRVARLIDGVRALQFPEG